MPIDRIPVFVRDDCLLPLAGPAHHVGDPALRELTVQVYGSGALGATLYEDDGVSIEGAMNDVRLDWDGSRGSLARSGAFDGPGFVVKGWDVRGE